MLLELRELLVVGREECARAALGVAAPLVLFGNLVLRPFDLGLVYMVAIPAVQGVGLVMAGWSSGNKYSLLGSARVVAQLISYELPIVVALLGVAMMAGSLSLTEIVEAQMAHGWNVFMQPLGFVIFFLAFRPKADAPAAAR